MKIKPEHIASEINHRLQILTIDFELFIKSSQQIKDEPVQFVLAKLTSMKETFVKIKNQDSLDAEDLSESRKVLDEIIENLLKIETKNPADKNEKMAILNQIYKLRELLISNRK